MDLVKNAKSVPSVPVGDVGSEGLVYVDTTTVAPSPSRDYYRLHVTHQFVRMTRWPITHRSAAPQPPEETKVPLDEFHTQHRLTSEVARIFGKDMAQYVTGLSLGHYDTIVRLPLKVLARIMEYVGIESLANLAPVCKRFHEVATGNTLWESFCTTYSHNAPGYDSLTAVKDYTRFGWKAVFLAFRLQDNIRPGKKLRLGTAKTGGLAKVIDGAGEGLGPIAPETSAVLQGEIPKGYNSLLYKPLGTPQSLKDLSEQAKMGAAAMFRRGVAKEGDAATSKKVVKTLERLYLRPPPGSQATRSRLSRSLQDVHGSLEAEDNLTRKSN